MSSILGELIESVMELKHDMKLTNEIYYRGETKSHYKLTPKLLRKSHETERQLFLRENDIYCRTIVMAANDLQSYQSSWQLLALFQHYQLPTRLLDWSSSLITAIMFAIEPCLECRNETCKSDSKCNKEDYNPRIWLLDPKKMHGDLHKRTKLARLYAVTIGVDDSKIQDYKTTFIEKRNSKIWSYKNGPIFLEIPWANPRIRAQKGYFTFHNDSIPLENMPTSRNWLSRIEISKHLISQLKDEISTIGTNEFDIYPDITNLSKFFERSHAKTKGLKQKTQQPKMTKSAKI
jgi:hypothetical protein